MKIPYLPCGEVITRSSPSTTNRTDVPLVPCIAAETVDCCSSRLCATSPRQNGALHHCCPPSSDALETGFKTSNQRLSQREPQGKKQGPTAYPPLRQTRECHATSEIHSPRLVPLYSSRPCPRCPRVAEALFRYCISPWITRPWQRPGSRKGHILRLPFCGPRAANTAAAGAWACPPPSVGPSHSLYE